MALAKRKEVVTALEKQNYGGILLGAVLSAAGASLDLSSLVQRLHSTATTTSYLS